MSKSIKDNKYYFKVSQDNPEEHLDEFYIFDQKHPDIKEYAKNTRRIKNILITIKILIGKKEKVDVVDKYYQELQKLLSGFSNCSEFSCFVNACDNTLNAVKDDLQLLKNITKRYFAKRVLNELAPEEWIQAILDSNSSRKKGKCGEIKLAAILKKTGFKKADSWEEFKNIKRGFAEFSEVFSMEEARVVLGIKIKTRKQGKNLDLIIKSDKRVFLVEAKHLNTSGGEQDKQISELIEILSLSEENKNISYVSFLDGSYSNILLAENIKKAGKKLKSQRREIEKYLRKNENNFWVNTAGFEALIIDL